MDKQTILWFLGFVFANGGALIAIYIKLISRITAIETFLRSQSERAMRALHSPDNHHGIDPLLDKYKANEGELSYDEWKELFDRNEKILNSEKSSPGEKALAVWVCTFAEHKLKCGRKFLKRIQSTSELPTMISN